MNGGRDMGQNSRAKRGRSSQDGHISHSGTSDQGERISLPDSTRKKLEDMQNAFVQEPTSSEIWASWWEFFRSIDEVYGLNNLDISDVRFLLSWSSAVARRESDHRKAVDLLRSYFRHPDVEEGDYWLNISMRCYLAECLLIVEEEQQAADVLRLLLDTRDRRLPRVIIEWLRNTLRDYCAGRPRSGKASTVLESVIYDVVRRLRRRSVPSHSRDDGSTYAELNDLLEIGFPVSTRERPESGRGVEPASPD
jgi:hypothetical protein